MRDKENLPKILRLKQENELEEFLTGVKQDGYESGNDIDSDLDLEHELEKEEEEE